MGEILAQVVLFLFFCKWRPCLCDWKHFPPFIEVEGTAAAATATIASLFDHGLKDLVDFCKVVDNHDFWACNVFNEVSLTLLHAFLNPWLGKAFVLVQRFLQTQVTFCGVCTHCTQVVRTLHDRELVDNQDLKGAVGRQLLVVEKDLSISVWLHVKRDERSVLQEVLVVANLLTKHVDSLVSTSLTTWVRTISLFGHSSTTTAKSHRFMTRHNLLLHHLWSHLFLFLNIVEVIATL